MTHPYRELETQKRGPLSLGEKAKAAFRGLARFEPLLEIASRGLEQGLPQAERLKYAARLGKSSSADRIYGHLAAEEDSCVKDALAYSFVEACHRRLGELDMALCSRYSAMGALSAVEDKERFRRESASMAASVLSGDAILSQHARSALESVALGRAQA